MSETFAPITIATEDLAPRECEVTLGARKYVLTEASCGAHVEYRNCLMRSTKFDGNMRPSGVDGMADAEPVLVSRCLFEVKKINNEERRVPVSEKEVRGWLARTVAPLFEMAKKLSGIDKEDSRNEAKAKDLLGLANPAAPLSPEERLGGEDATDVPALPKVEAAQGEDPARKNS